MGETLLDESARSFVSRSSNPPISSIAAENWIMAEQLTEGVIRRIQPTKAADEKRREIVEHVRRLVRGAVDVDIFPFGSFPLKTYLPDGDIDLTVISRPGTEEALSRIVLAILQEKEHDWNHQFEIKDVQYINAEVKLVKCLIEDVLVDISFQQTGGLCSLYFLEKMDEMIGKDHILKRSILLIKAWCYYESRILGSHYGLLSSYALETLVLYVFHAFPCSLDGPLSVFYIFLDFFGQFDWDNFCVTLSGPVCLSSFPEIVAVSEKLEGGERLIPQDFLRKFEEELPPIFFGPEGNSDTRSFHKKHLNIIDPLKPGNNLGRSVNKGSCYRIRSAFSYGARKLGNILSLPRDELTNEFKIFFRNSLDHCNCKQLNEHEFFQGEEASRVPSSQPEALIETSLLSDLTGDDETHVKSLQCAMSCFERPPPSLFHDRKLHDGHHQPNWTVSSTIPHTLSSTYSPSRGTGTYIPKRTNGMQKERETHWRGSSDGHLSHCGKFLHRRPGPPVRYQASSCSLSGLGRRSSSSVSQLEAGPVNHIASEPVACSRKGGKSKEERIEKGSSFRLKNDEDFPPLLSESLGSV
ncbi:PAP/OAS1 substrate-binding domain superfamily [Wolffia australiana]